MKTIQKENSVITRYKGESISDFHLFSKDDDSLKTAYLGMQLIKSLNKNDYVVINGDGIENEYGKYGIKETANVAIEYLDIILSKPEFKHKKLVYIPGNHDCRRYFTDSLEKLAQKHDNFIYACDGYKLDGKLFVHGDRELRKNNELYGSFYPEKTPFFKRFLINGVNSERGGMLIGLAYDILEDTVIKFHDKIFHKPSIVAKHIVNAYKDDPLRLENVDTIITGHTHVPFFGEKVDFNGRTINVHNTGTPRESSLEHSGLNYLPLRFVYEVEHNHEGKMLREKCSIPEKYMTRFYSKMQHLISESEKSLPGMIMTQIEDILKPKQKQQGEDAHLFI